MADTTTKKFLSLEGLQDYDALIKQEIQDEVSSAVSNKADSSHSHNDLYYTESEVDSKISAVNTSITNITSGTTVVKKAEYATTAGTATSATTANSATKATQDASGNVITTTYETKSDATAKLTEAKTYADTAATKVKNDLLNGAGTAYDTLKELGDLIVDNADAIDALETIASGKANASHTHAIADVSGLQSALDGKAAASHGTHVTYGTTAPVMNGTASVGTATTVARSDHRHPTDTSRAAQTDLDALAQTVSGKADSGHTHSAASTSAAGFMTAAMVTKLNSIAEGANKITVDSALSTSSTNPVRNSVVATALNNATEAIGLNTQSINSHTTSITNLQNAINDITEITVSEIQSLFAK